MLKARKLLATLLLATPMLALATPAANSIGAGMCESGGCSGPLPYAGAIGMYAVSCMIVAWFRRQDEMPFEWAPVLGWGFAAILPIWFVLFGVFAAGHALLGLF